MIINIVSACLSVLCVAVGVSLGIVGVQLHVGPGWDAGSEAQWVALAIITMGLSGLLASVLALLDRCRR